MFANVAITLASLFVFVAAIPPPAPAASSCNSGALTCCNNLQDSHSISDVDQFSIMSELGLSALTGQVGSACSPIAGGTSGDVSCTQQTACCDHVSSNGFIAAGCMPIKLT